MKYRIGRTMDKAEWFCERWFHGEIFVTFHRTFGEAEDAMKADREVFMNGLVDRFYPEAVSHLMDGERGVARSYAVRS